MTSQSEAGGVLAWELEKKGGKKGGKATGCDFVQALGSTGNRSLLVLIRVGWWRKRGE